MTAPLSIRVVTDGRAGIEAQALGLAEAVARLTPAALDVRRVRWRAPFDRLPSAFKAPWMLDAAFDAPLAPPWPDLWIGCGRASLPLSVRAGPLSGGRTRVVQVQDPRWRRGAYDLVVAPRHDGLAGPNVVSILGSPNRVAPERLAAARAVFADRIRPLPRPRVAVLIGGRSRAFDLPPDHAADLGRRIAGAVSAAGGSVMATVSRRTPPEARDALAAALADTPGWVWDGTGDNPLFAMLDAADHVLVTEDSANMATEAASTGRPVHVLPMVRRGRADKFDRLHAELQAGGFTRPFDGDLTGRPGAPLVETDRAARIVLDRLFPDR